MNEELMHTWIDSVFKIRGPYLATEPSLLVMDSHRSHYADSVIDSLKHLNVKVKLVPPKMTSFLQPLDVSGGPNGVFKKAMREQWQTWFINGPKEYTPKGNRKRASYECILEMVSASMKVVNQDVIRRSFQLSGITCRAQPQSADLNSRLRGVLGYIEGLEVFDDSAVDGESDDPFSDDDELTAYNYFVHVHTICQIL
jgi:hypothetical protein